jgi:hypothetical protein
MPSPQTSSLAAPHKKKHNDKKKNESSSLSRGLGDCGEFYRVFPIFGEFFINSRFFVLKKSAAEKLAISLIFSDYSAISSTRTCSHEVDYMKILSKHDQRIPKEVQL